MTNRRNQIQASGSQDWLLFSAIHQTADAPNYLLLTLFACALPLL